jgi:hypothetical protein
MEQYKIRPEGIRQIRNQSLRQSVPLTLLAVATGCFLSYPNFNSSVMMLFIPLMVGVVSFGIYKGAARVEQLFGSYTLTIDEESITRDQFNTPSIRIPFGNISMIDKNAAGGFTIHGTKTVDKIIIPPQIQEAERLEEQLNRIKNITINASPSFLDRYRIVLAVANLASMAIVFMVSNKIAVAIAGLFLLSLNSWSLVVVFQSKNIDRKTKKSMYWLVPFLLAILFAMYYKLFR